MEEKEKDGANSPFILYCFIFVSLRMPSDFLEISLYNDYIHIEYIKCSAAVYGNFA